MPASSQCWSAVLLVLAVVGKGEPVLGNEPDFKQQPLFQSGLRGYHCYRIPSLCVTRQGTVLAFCEARKKSCSDHGDIDLVVKRSSDGGRSWSKMHFVADDGDHTMGNPCPVVDRSNGTIWLPFCRDNKRILMTSSTDDGRTWSKPQDVTTDAMNGAWHWVGTGPGHGIQLQSGRLLVPCWADAAERLGEIQLSYVFYSDDHGATWKRGGTLDHNASDECEVVELAGGGLYMNMRQRRGKQYRAYSYSKDGGKTWSAVKYDSRLPAPKGSCQGSVVRFTDTRRYQKSRILLATPTDARTRLRVRVSYDESKSWPVSKLIYAGSAAYSDLAVTPDANILLFYEADNYTKIVLARFNIEWLTDRRDRLRKKAE